MGPLRAKLASVTLAIAHRLVATKAGRTPLGIHVLVNRATTVGPARLKAKVAIGDQQVDQIAVRAATATVRRDLSVLAGLLELKMIVQRGRLIAMLGQAKAGFKTVPMLVVRGVRSRHPVGIRTALARVAQQPGDLRGLANEWDERRPRRGVRHVLPVGNVQPVAPTV